jgi:hypothetical protein
MTRDEDISREQQEENSPVSTGVGAAGGAALGAAAGAVIGGPVGALVGGMGGAVMGGVVGKATAMGVKPGFEEDYWRTHYQDRPYARADRGYDEYLPAYRYGWESRGHYEGRTFDEVEKDLEAGWDRAKDKSKLAWLEAKEAARDAWDRVERSVG